MATEQQTTETPATDEKVIPIGRAGEEQIERWKKEHPQGIHSIILQREDGQFGEVYFCKPNRNHLNYSRSKRNPNSQLDEYTALAEVTFIGGDESLLKDEQAMISICHRMENMEVGKAYIVLNH